MATAMVVALPAAQAQEYRRRRQRDVAADSASPAPAYGNAARGLGRERRRAAAPVRRRLAEPKPKNDSGDAEAVEEIAADAAVTTSADGPETWWGDAWPIWDRVLDVYTPRPVRPRTVNFQISHRSATGILRDPLWNAFGIDAFTNVGLGVRVGILDRLDVGVERWGNSLGHDNYEFDVRGQILKQDAMYLDLSLRAGLNWFAQQKAPDAFGIYGELMLGRLLFHRLWLSGNAIMHTSSSGPEKTNRDSKGSAALQFAADYRIRSNFSWALEATRTIVGYGLPYPVLTTGPRFITNRHTFSIVLSNSSYFSTDAIITDSRRLNPKDWRLGFHITREL